MDPPAAHLPLLQASDLSFSRNHERIFGPLTFHLHAAEALMLRGGNGAGKTTLLRVLAGLLVQESGEVLIDGNVINRDHMARFCAFLGHSPGHKPVLGCLENLRYAASLHGASPDNKVLETALAEVGLSGFEDSEPGRMSAGQNKRLSLARLLLHPARVWLLDEPYANLDLDGIALVNAMVERHIAAGHAVLLTTHGAYAAPPVPVRTLALHSDGPP